MKITKITAGMGRTISSKKNQFENYKPHTEMEVSVDETDDVQEVKGFIREHLRLWQAEIENDIMQKDAGTNQGNWTQPPMQTQFGPQGPHPARKAPATPSTPVNGPYPQTQPPQKPNVGQMFNGPAVLGGGPSPSVPAQQQTAFDDYPDWEEG